MSTVRFPYDLASRDALIELIKIDRPGDRIDAKFTVFEDMVHAPTPSEPGRTYIEMTNQLTGIKKSYIYRRLDLETILNQYLEDDVYINTIYVVGVITRSKIINEVNRMFGLKLGADDVTLGNTSITPLNSMLYKIETLPSSYAYYGDVVVQVISTPDVTDRRIVESGESRLTEEGLFRARE